MDDRDVAEEPDLDVVRLEILDRDRLRRLLQERFPVDEGAVGVRAEEVVRQDLVEATDVRVLNGLDVVPVQVSQDFELGLGRSRDLRSLPRLSEKYLPGPGNAGYRFLMGRTERCANHVTVVAEPLNLD